MIQTFREFPKQLRGVILSSWEDWCESAKEPGVTLVTFVTLGRVAAKQRAGKHVTLIIREIEATTTPWRYVRDARNAQRY